MCKADASTINFTVKAPGNIIYRFPNQHIRSLEEIHELIQSINELRSFITENTILMGDDNQVLTPQHLVSARESGSLNITLSDPDTIDTGSEIHKENLRNAFM